MANSFRYTGQDTVAHTPTDYSQYYADKSRSYMSRALDASTLSQTSARRSMIAATAAEQHRDETMTARNTTVDMVSEAEKYRNETHTDRQAAQTARTGAEAARDQAGTHASSSAASSSTAADILAANQALGIIVDTSVGTRVFVGDTMIRGETGWRDIGLRLLDGWTPAANRVLIMREGNDVTLRLDSTRTSDASTFSNILDIPPGFNPAGRARIAPVFVTSSKQGWFDNISGPLRVRDLPSALSEGDRITTTVKWATTDPWPTSLPDTPA